MILFSNLSVPRIRDDKNVYVIDRIVIPHNCCLQFAYILSVRTEKITKTTSHKL